MYDITNLIWKFFEPVRTKYVSISVCIKATQKIKHLNNIQYNQIGGEMKYN